MMLLVGDDEVLIEEATHWWYFSTILFHYKIKNSIIIEIKIDKIVCNYDCMYVRKCVCKYVCK